MFVFVCVYVVDIYICMNMQVSISPITAVISTYMYSSQNKASNKWDRSGSIYTYMYTERYFQAGKLLLILCFEIRGGDL